MRLAIFVSGGFITNIVVNPPEKKLEKRTSVQCVNGTASKIAFLPFQLPEQHEANCDLKRNIS